MKRQTKNILLTAAVSFLVMFAIGIGYTMYDLVNEPAPETTELPIGNFQ